MVSGGQRKDDIKKSKKSNAKIFFNTHLLLTAKFNSAFLASWFGDGPRRPRRAPPRLDIAHLSFDHPVHT